MFSKLKSGTDVRGRAMGENPDITAETAFRLGYAFTKWLKKNDETDIKIAFGRDSRLSGPKLLNACAQGAMAAGAKVLDFGLCTTPAMFYSLSYEPLNLCASIMVTASHHPKDRNGFKFFIKRSGISSSELDQILDEASKVDKAIVQLEDEKTIERFDYLSVYSGFLEQLVRDKLETDVLKPLLGLHVVVDASSGAGGFYEKVLQDLGAWTEGSINLKPDGNFPAHPPNPENPEAMQCLSEAVLKAGADLGVIFDTDCDRAAIIDQSGKEINRNRLIAMVSVIILNKTPGAAIVTDSVTSSGLSKFIEEWGGVHHRYKRGYRNVIEEAMRLNRSGVDAPLAMETSGHAAFRENHFVDDGMYLATILICEAMRLKRSDKLLGDLLEGLQEPIESVEIRLPITDEDFLSTGLETIESVMEYANTDNTWHIAPDNREGVRINFNLNGEINSAWFLLRLSVHDPVLPLNAESDVAGGVKQILTKLYDVLKQCEGVDLKPLREYLEKEN
ncbi:MAG: phosphomannomutase/phosphoglucomutase [Christensenellales bacterium]|jgi:phosphomannomutase